MLNDRLIVPSQCFQNKLVFVSLWIRVPVRRTSTEAMAAVDILVPFTKIAYSWSSSASAGLALKWSSAKDSKSFSQFRKYENSQLWDCILKLDNEWLRSVSVLVPLCVQTFCSVNYGNQKQVNAGTGFQRSFKFLSLLSFRTEKLVNIFENSNFNYPRVTVALRKV